MAVKYQKLESPRFRIDNSRGHERIEISPRRRIFLSLFLSFWLCAWTAGGIAAFASLFVKFNAFTLFWLGGWAFGWILAALNLAWLFGGSETLDVANGDLDITYRVLGFPIRKLFRGRDIRRLMPDAADETYRRFGMPLPFLSLNKSGSIKFSYGSRTIYAGGDLDEEEGRLIVERLAKRLPPSATATTP